MISFCSFLLKNFYDENLDFFTNARVQKIQQPSRKELILHLRNHQKTKKLYINISSDFFHVCFPSDDNFKKREIEIPKVPPMFCMLLRKYIENSRIVKVEIPDYERILELYFENYNEIGEKFEICLAIELMGKHSNIILYSNSFCDEQNKGKILGCMHNVGEEKSQIRELSGGLPYVYPPKKSKKDFFISSKEKFEKEKLTAQNSFYYLTYPILDDANYDYEKLVQMFFEPKIFINENDFSFFKKNENYIQTDFNSAIDFYWSKCQSEAILKNLRSNLKNLIERKIKKQRKIIEKAESEVEKSKDYEEIKNFGDLILSNIYKIKPGDKILLAQDYVTGNEIKIKLDENLTPSQNAQKYYKNYSKNKKTFEFAKKRLDEARDYLEFLIEAQMSAELIETSEELREFRENFEKEKPILKSKTIQKIENIKINDFDIFIGKNHFQNDYLLSKIASPEDIWLHLKDEPSAHIIIKKREKEIDEKTIFEAAKLVKYYSKARNSSKVCVIYTQRKFVRKIPKSKYGLVNYREEKEIVLD